jgi:DNA-binding LacI/PurR family transcriptional regulator
MAKRIGIKDIAKKAGVSLSSVSQALNNPSRVSREVRLNVLEAANWLGYIKKKPAGVQKEAIGIIADNYANIVLGEFYNVVVLGILEEAKRLRLNVIVESFEREGEHFPKTITRNLVDGILFLGKVSREHILMTQRRGIPFVLVGHPIPDVELSSIVSDSRGGAVQAVDHLIGLGHDKIGMIIGEPAIDPISSERIEGYRFAMMKASLKTPDEYIAEADFGKPETAIKAVKRLLNLKEPPTAIFCTSDSLAYRAYRGVKELGLKIPKDISIVGFDDIFAPEFSELPGPSLTTVNVNRTEMGKTAVNVLLDIIQNPTKTAYRHTLPARLVSRKSTAAPRAC